MTRKDATKLFLRFLVIFALCCPLFIAIGIALGDNVNGVLETTIFVVVAGGVLMFEEYFYWKRWKARQIAKRATNPDKYFAEIKQKEMQKRRVVENAQPKNTEKNTTENTIKRNNRRNKNG